MKRRGRTVLATVAAVLAMSVPAIVHAETSSAEPAEPGRVAKTAALTPAAPAGGAVSQTREEPAIAAKLSLDRASMTTADRATLTIDVVVADKFEVLQPDIATVAGADWVVKSGPYSPAKIDRAGKTTQRFTFLLEPMAPGELEIGAVVVSARPKGGDDVSARSVTFEPIRVSVATVLPGEDWTPGAAHGDVIDPLLDWKWWALNAVAAGCVVASIVLLAQVLIARRRRLAAEPVRRLAHELAFERLERLLRTDLIARGDYKRFLGELSFILRQYIEDRYGLHAPDRTTEEFLAEVRSPSGAGVLHQDDVPVLARFLAQCDLVQFANATIGPADMDEMVRTVREFIERTRSPDKLVIVEGQEAPGMRRAGAEGVGAAA
ncbi:MAG TPA: hypothetical protein VG797_08445 [Phycisphaerales bacterium]|nr:hypothetical protein [Phycisphaerales bacterium]